MKVLRESTLLMALKPEPSTHSNPSPRPWGITSLHPLQSLAGHQELQEGDSLVRCPQSRRDHTSEEANATRRMPNTFLGMELLPHPHRRG